MLHVYINASQASDHKADQIHATVNASVDQHDVVPAQHGRQAMLLCKMEFHVTFDAGRIRSVVIHQAQAV
jgi:hypothetical protein